MLDINSLISRGGQPFFRLANADGKIWLMPKQNMTTAMGLYQPSGSKGIILKKLFPVLNRIPFVSRLAHAESINLSLDDDILRAACNAFGVSNLEYSVFGGTPSVHRKITIQFFNGKKILGYGKVTDNPDIEKLFVKERILLDYLNERGVTGIPKCLLVDRPGNELTLFIQTTEKRQRSFSPKEWTPMHDKFIQCMTAGTAVPVPFAESDFYRNLSKLVEYLHVLPEGFKSIISRSLDVVHQEFGMETYLFMAYHGDFTPWNMFVDDNRLFVFDWEYAELSYPPGLDRYHFHIQQYIHLERLMPGEIHDRLLQKEWFNVKTLRYYLLDIISRFVCRERGAVSEDLSKMLDIWTSLLKRIE